MSQISRFLLSSVGQKILMALTGLLLIGFLVIHLSANLLVFESPDAYNAYSHKLISNPLIYVAEAILLLLFLAHLVTGIIVYRRNSDARPTAYQKKTWARHGSHKSIASTTMILSGLVVLVFVPLHIWTFKFGTYYASTAHPEERDLYRLVIETFHEPLYVLWYVVAMVIIGAHLWHGFGSAFQSSGIYYRKGFRRFGQVLAIVLAGGFLLIPVIVYFMGGRL